MAKELNSLEALEEAIWQEGKAITFSEMKALNEEFRNLAQNSQANILARSIPENKPAGSLLDRNGHGS